MTRIALIAVFLLTLMGNALAQNDRNSFYLDGVAYDPDIPKVEDVLGFEPGDHTIRHHQLVDFLTRTAAASDRITLETIGYTHERRPILFLTITSPENHARIDEIRAQHLALTDPASDREPAADMPVITWLNYGVHGAESSGMDAALPTVYHLAAARGPEIEQMLRESVIVITAIFNPDGHSRRVAWVEQNTSEVKDPNPDARIHNTYWPGGRTNHYWFDLNRQWLPVTQPESQAWLRKFHEWRPNLAVDYHEMGSNATYYFHPGVPSRTYPGVPDVAIDLINEAANYPSKVLDEAGLLYYTEEGFDNFYIGKGSTYPYMNGGIGFLYEAGRAAGGLIDSVNGPRTYRENIWKHFRTSLASIEAARAMRPRLLDHQRKFYQDALKLADDEAIKAYVFQARGDKGRMFHFLELLSRHRITYHRLGESLAIDGVQYDPAEAYIVRLGQPQYRLIKAFFEIITEFEDSTFYDISSWTLPHAYGLEFTGLNARRFKTGLVGEAGAPVRVSAPSPDKAAFAYIFPWSDYYAPRALQRIVGEGLFAKVATAPFTVLTTTGPVAMERGAILIPLDHQEQHRDRIDGIMQTIAAEDGIEVHAVTSGRTPDTGVDLGGPSFQPVTAPKALLAVGEGVTAYDAGEVWHLLDHRMKVPVTLRDRRYIVRGGLDGYTHLILPGGNYGNMPKAFSKELKNWVRAGGTIVAINQAAEWVNDTVLSEEDEEEGSSDKGEKEDGADRIDYAEKNAKEAEGIIGGAIFGGDLDITHPLGFGYNRRSIASHRDTTLVLPRPENPYATVIRYNDPPLISGFTSAAIQQKIAGSAALIAERMGRGSVILFADNPNFRGYWFGTNKLFLNSLYFSRAFNAPSDGDEAE